VIDLQKLLSYIHVSEWQDTCVTDFLILLPCSLLTNICVNDLPTVAVLQYVSNSCVNEFPRVAVLQCRGRQLYE